MSKMVVVDFQYLYYKYKNAIESGKMKKLSSIINGQERDTSLIYYPIKEIEGFNGGGRIRTAVCFDSKSIREKENDTYKANRVNTLDGRDFDEIAAIRQTLTDAGYDTYKEDGMEADDLIASIVNTYAADYEETMLCTIDKDLMQLIQPGVSLNLYRIFKGYIYVSMNNFEDFATQSFKTFMPYNMIMAYKSLCGDPSDGIPGIRKFGPAAFGKWLSNWNGVDFSKGMNKEFVRELLETSLPSDKLAEAISSLNMVAFKDVTVAPPAMEYNQEKRVGVFSRLGFNSLLK